MSSIRHEVEPSAKDQVTHDVVVQIRRPLRHVERLRPVFPVLPTLEYNILKSPHVLHQVFLRCSQGFVGERMLHHPSVSCVNVSISLGMDAGRTSC